MDAIDVAKVCLRRWYVFLPILALAMGSALGLSSERAVQYSASGSFALVYDQGAGSPVAAQDPRLYNPLASDGGGLLSEALIAELNSSAMQRQLGSPSTRATDSTKGATGQRFGVQLPYGTRSIIVSAFGPDPRAARGTVDAVLGAAPGVVRSIQTRAGAPVQSQMGIFITLPSQVDALPPPSKAKLLVAITGVGGLAGAALSILLDRLVSRRRKRPSTRGFLRRRRERAATTTWETSEDIQDGSSSATDSTETHLSGVGAPNPSGKQSENDPTSTDTQHDGVRETVRT